jgi:hypothetical protein
MPNAATDITIFGSRHGGAEESAAARPSVEVPYVRGRDPFGMLLSWN